MVTDLVRSVSIDLNDQEPENEYIHWPYAQLRGYLFEALQQIAPYTKKFFTHRKRVKVKPGATWQRVCCDCDQIVRVIGEVDKDGKLLHTLRRIQDNPDNEWPVATGRLCPAMKDPDKYEMDGYSISNIDDTYFQVVPPVPEGAERYILLECFTGVHCITDNYDVYWRFVPLCKIYMLARAYMMDSENNPAVFQMGATYMDRFDKLFAKLLAEMEKEKQEKCIGADDCVGAVPNKQT